LFSHAQSAQPAEASLPATDGVAFIDELNAFRRERSIEPVQFDSRLATLLDGQARGEITLTQLLDQHAALCASGRWLVLAAPTGEDLPVLLRSHADSVTQANFTRAAIDLLTPTDARPATYRVLLCRPY